MDYIGAVNQPLPWYTSAGIGVADLNEPQNKRRRASKKNERALAATVHDVARLANVSTATVSRALNSPDLVSPEVRERVSNAVKKLGYIPNDSARALRQSQTRLIGVIVPTLNYALYAAFFSAVREALGKSGYFPVLTTSEYDLGAEADEIRKLAKHGAQGLILVGLLRDPDAAGFLAASGIPHICTYATNLYDSETAIGFDNTRAIEDVVEYLVSLGHRRLAMLSGVTSNRNDRALARRAGFVNAVRAHRLECADWVAEQPYTIEGGRSALCDILDRGLQPSAIVCGSDMLAIGALQECKARGINVPQDLSIMGFDDLEIAAHLDPALSTVAVPSRDLGRLAAESIVTLCSGGEPQRHAALGTRLVIRSTTAAPPAPKARHA